MDSHESGTITKRLERLERENRRWRWIGGVVLIGALVLLAGGAERSKVVDAERLVLRDKAGKTRAVLEVKDDAIPRLVLLDAGGKDAVELGVDPQLGSFLSLRHEQAGTHVWALANKLGAAQFDLSVSDGERLSLLTSGGNDKAARLSLGPLLGPDQVQLSFHEDQGWLEFCAGKGEFAPRIMLGSNRDGSLDLQVERTRDHPCLILGAKPDGSPFLKLLDRTGDPLFPAPGAK